MSGQAPAAGPKLALLRLGLQQEQGSVCVGVEHPGLLARRCRQTHRFRIGKAGSKPDSVQFRIVLAQAAGTAILAECKEGFRKGIPDGGGGFMERPFAHSGLIAVAVCLLVLEGCGGGTPAPEMETSCSSGEECDDENPCTENDKCDGDGECVGDPISCDDKRDCTADSCDAAGKCVHELMAGYCLINGICYEDGQPKPGNQCIECMIAGSKSEWTNDDTNECGTVDKCHTGAYCSDGECVPGTELLDCDDGNGCTDDSCDPDEGCVNTPNSEQCDGGLCVDGDCICQPDCEDKECGEDGCSGDCGGCGDLEACSDAGLCECVFVECDGACCENGLLCFKGQCCLPKCTGKECGDNGCGGNCGGCTPGYGCTAGTCLCTNPSAPASIWDRTYGGIGDDQANDFLVHPDGGYALAAVSKKESGWQTWLIRTNEEGDVLWEQTIGQDNWAWQIALASDGGFALAGTAKFNSLAESDGWLVRTDSSGGLQWEKTYGGANADGFASMRPLPDGEFLLAGLTASQGAGEWDVWLTKVDNQGTAVWETVVGGPEKENATDLALLAEGGYALAGWTASSGAGMGDFWLARMDVDGSKLWEKTYGGSDNETAYAIAVLPDGGYALAGTRQSATDSNDVDAWIVRTDVQGNVLWEKVLGGEGPDAVRAVVAMPDSGIAVAGSTIPPDSANIDMWLVRTDSAGTIVWEATYGGPNKDAALALSRLPDNSFVLVGWTDSIDDGGKDVWLVKTGTECCLPQCNGNVCGEDGCGGSCGECAGNLVCYDGLCTECIPFCTDKECGDDGCEGDCGSCGEGLTCQWGKCLDKTASTYMLIPAGEFTMGSPDGSGATPAEKCRSAQEIQHTVQLSHPFWMKATEVTIGEWTAVTGSASPSWFQACGPNCPANAMSWYQAVDYCNTLSSLEGLPQCYIVSDEGDVDWPVGYACPGYRLPTEAEWEYAARAGTTTALYNGPLEHCLCEYDATLAAIAWYVGNFQEVTYEGCVDTSENNCPGPTCVGPQPVAEKTPNAWGLFDMSGGVWEWCWDWFGPYGGDVIDPAGPSSGETMVLRGGSWGDHAKYARSACRLGNYAPSAQSYPFGFRPVRTACELQCDAVECGAGFCGGDCGACP